MAKITTHRRAIGSVLHTGMARGNPHASLHGVNLYVVPVLLSGLSSLVISLKEEEMIQQHHKDIITGNQRLLPRTPRAVIYFLAGSLPGSALLHLQQLSIFGMITRLPNNILHQHALNIYSSSTKSTHSWFHQIRDLCLLYHLPHPCVLLQTPLSKTAFKDIFKKHVIAHWERTLRAEASPLPSLNHFKPCFMSLRTPHPLWTTAGCSPVVAPLSKLPWQLYRRKCCQEDIELTIFVDTGQRTSLDAAFFPLLVPQLLAIYITSL